MSGVIKRDTRSLDNRQLLAWFGRLYSGCGGLRMDCLCSVVLKELE